MANAGHFVDRFPGVKCAGVPSDPTDTNNVSLCLNIIKPEELAESWIRRKQRPELFHHSMKRSPKVSPCEVKELISSDLKNADENDLREQLTSRRAVFEKNKPKAYLTAREPDLTKLSEPVYSIIMPNKTDEEVNREYGEFHEKYVLSHNRYFPGEQVNRHYTEPAFDRNMPFGISSNCDFEGKLVRNCMHMPEEEWGIGTKAHSDYIKRSVGPVGRKPMRYYYDVPQYEDYGKSLYPKDCDMKMMMENIETCAVDTKLQEAYKYMIRVRHALYEPTDKSTIFNLLSILKAHEKNVDQMMPLSVIFETMKQLNMTIDFDQFYFILNHLKLINKPVGNPALEQVNYLDVTHILMLEHEFCNIGSLGPLPTTDCHKHTTYRNFCKDRDKPLLEVKGKKKLYTLDELEEKLTTMADIVNPNIQGQYGLASFEFDRMRPKVKLVGIFKNLIEEAEFEKAWQVAVERFPEQENRFSVNQMRLILNDLLVPIKLS